jgi:hypothetical protein
MGFPKIKYQHIPISVGVAGQVIPIEAETDKLYNTCTGINVVISDEAGKFSKLQLDINGQEIFPENFEVLRLLFREHAPFGFDYHKLKEPAGGSKIKGSYTDQVGALAYPYQVVISFRLENVEPTDAGKVD